MRVSVEPGPAIEGHLTYRQDEYSFSFEASSSSLVMAREGDAGRSSVAVGTLQIEVGTSTRTALFAWGLYPRNNWREASLPLPSYESGLVHFDAAFDPGVSLLIAEVGEWSSSYDLSTGWLRLACDSEPHEHLTEVATNILLGDRQRELSSIWLRPRIV